MDRFSLILTSLPPELSEELLTELKGLGWAAESPLPMVLISGVSDSEARIRKTDFEFLGVDLEIVPADFAADHLKKSEATPKEQPKEELSLEDLTLEITPAPAEFQLAPLVEEPPTPSETPLWELDEDDAAALTPASSQATSQAVSPAPASQITKPQSQEISQFTFSLEDEPSPPPQQITKQEFKPVPDPTPLPTAKAPSAPPKETFSLLFEQETKPTSPPVPPPAPALAPPVFETGLKPEPEKIAPPTEPKEIEAEQPSSIPPSVTDSAAKAQAIGDDSEEEWPEIDEEEEDSENEPAIPKKKKNLALGGGIVIIFLLLGYIYLSPEPLPPEADNETSNLVNSLLNQQEKILKDERQAALQALNRKPEVPSEVIEGIFPLKLSNGEINGEVRFGRYQAGLLIESLKLIEEKQQKLSPQDMAAGKTPRPWLKNFQLELPPVGMREPLGATYKLKSETRAYVEDSNGTVRVPCVLELDCEFKSGANLNCYYDIKNKALYKKPTEPATKSGDSPSTESSSSDTPQRKTQLTIEREPALGFLVLISGDFQAKLNPK